MDVFLTMCDYWLWFVAYSIAGWIYEMLIFRVTEKKFVRRGFLYGPFCPIYGAGAVLFWLTLRWVPDVIRPMIPNAVGAFFVEGIILFLLGGFMACVMEYVTSAILEHCFHTRWWDYFRNRFNIKGRVCLLGFTAFGAFAVLIIEFLQPWVVWVTDQIWDTAIMIAAIATGAWMLLDFIFTLVRVIRNRNNVTLDPPPAKSSDKDRCAAKRA
ncbi:MAG: putative ABC transporter permease [Oscillospiraceae bacterium]|nr:putative ABC transporter permease [Oscillospiraceae bacterium]